MRNECAICGGTVVRALYDGGLGEAKVLLCAKCLSMLRTHPEERALLAILRFGHPLGLGSPHRRRASR